MNYPFECPECGHSEIISMPMSQYTSSGHYCPVCGEEMTRKIKSMVCGCSVDKTGDFYQRVTF